MHQVVKEIPKRRSSRPVLELTACDHGSYPTSHNGCHATRNHSADSGSAKPTQRVRCVLAKQRRSSARTAITPSCQRRDTTYRSVGSVASKRVSATNDTNATSRTKASTGQCTNCNGVNAAIARKRRGRTL